MRCLLTCQLFLSLMMMGAIPAVGHEVEVCLAKLSQKSGQLQACRINQTEASQCDAIEQRLAYFQQECRQRQFPEEHIARAIAYGASEVQGSPDQSPYQKRLARERWQQAATGPNLQRFSVLFPDFEHFQPSLLEHFGTATCPTAYEGRQGRWLHGGNLLLQRYSLENSTNSPAITVQLHLFAPESPNRCYPVPSPAEGQHGSVINIPEQLVQEIETQGLAIRCDSADCSPARNEVLRAYQQYQGAYREYRQLMVCADTSLRNDVAGAGKGAKSGSSLPEYCPEKEIDVAYLNAKGLVEELEQRLFNPRKVPPPQAKPSQN